MSILWRKYFRHIGNNCICSLFFHCQPHFRWLTGVCCSGLKLSGLETALSPPSNARSWNRYPSYLCNITARTSTSIILPSFLLLLSVKKFAFLWTVFSSSLFLEKVKVWKTWYKNSCYENKSRIIIEYTTPLSWPLKTLLDNLRWQPKQTIWMACCCDNLYWPAGKRDHNSHCHVCN